MNRTDFQNISILRIDEAKVLLDNQQYSGSYYLSGYSVECALKACIAKNIQQYEIPDKKFLNDFYIHDFNKLIKLASQHLQEETNNTNFKAYWNVTKDWKETSRYTTKSQIESEEFFEAITNQNDGVLRWIRNYW